jgi:Mce-associated membrane protein
MSPRRKIEPGEEFLFAEQTVMPRFRMQWRRFRTLRWGLPLATTAAVLLTAAVIAACTVMLISHESHRRAAMKDVSVLTYVRSFMTGFTSPDPFHANEYVERVLAESTGGFAKEYQERANQVLVQVARAERTTGTVLDAGVERWNDDGSANVLVATEVTSQTPDGKDAADATFRWVVTAKHEGDQWKISNLVQVI